MKHSDKGEITGFEIKGVSEDVLKRCSRRREQIDKEIEKFVSTKGRQPTPDEVKLMTLLTRGRKMLEKTTDQVIAFKMSLFTEEERSYFRSMASEAEQLSFLMPPRPGRETPEQQIRKVVEQLFERNGVLRWDAILAEVQNQRRVQVLLVKNEKEHA